MFTSTSTSVVRLGKSVVEVMTSYLCKTRSVTFNRVMWMVYLAHTLCGKRTPENVSPHLVHRARVTFPDLPFDFRLYFILRRDCSPGWNGNLSLVRHQFRDQARLRRQSWVTVDQCLCYLDPDPSSPTTTRRRLPRHPKSRPFGLWTWTRGASQVTPVVDPRETWEPLGVRSGSGPLGRVFTVGWWPWLWVRVPH